MLKLRVREYSPAGARGRVLPAKTINITDPENGGSTLSFVLSKRAAGALQNLPFVVGVEYAVGNQRFQPVSRNDMFMVTEDSGDDADQTKTITFTGVNATWWDLGGHVLGWLNSSKNKERKFGVPEAPVAASAVMRLLVIEGKAWGWAPRLGFDSFTNTHDSNGQAFSTAEKIAHLYPIGTYYSKILESLTSQGLCDWDTQGFALRLYRPGTTRDKTNVVLGGPRFSRIPVKTDANAMYSHISVNPEAGDWFGIDIAGADTRFGARNMFLSQSGVKDRASAEKVAAPHVHQASKLQREETFEWTPDVEDFVPWRDFVVSDTVTARSRGAKVQRKVIGIIARFDGTSTVVQTRVGEKIGTFNGKLARKISSVTNGTAGGTGAGFPASPGPEPARPAAPAGLMVSGNTGWWDADATAHSRVSLSWAPVTHDTDGWETTIAEYEVWSRDPATIIGLDTASTSTQATVETWASGRERLVSVRARSTEGKWSEWSAELSVTPLYPSSIVPKPPGALSVASNVAAFTAAGPVATVAVTVPPVTESTDNEPIMIGEYELLVDGLPHSRFPASPARFTLPTGATAKVRVRAKSSLGVWGDLSDELTVTGAEPAETVRAPSAPTLATGYGDVVARWDGTYTGGGITGAHTVWVEARIAATLDPPAPASAWARQGPALTGAGSALIRLGEVGDLLEVRIVAYDQLGRETGASGVVSIEIETIDGAVITAGTIRADQLVPNIGDDLNLAANGSIVLIAGRQDAQDAAIGEVDSRAEEALDRAEAAASEAGAARSQADLAAGAALVAQNLASDVNAALNLHKTVFIVDEYGAIIAAVDRTNELRMRSTYIAMAQNGVEVTRWEGNRMIVNEAVLNRARIATISIEPYGANGTVIRQA